MAGARTLSRNGRVGPNRATEAAPNSPSGPAAISSSSRRGPSPRSAREGSPGWAPIQSSACGSPVGSCPSSSGSAVTDPQAYGRTVLTSLSMGAVLLLCCGGLAGPAAGRRPAGGAGGGHPGKGRASTLADRCLRRGNAGGRWGVPRAAGRFENAVVGCQDPVFSTVSPSRRVPAGAVSPDECGQR